MLDTSRTSFYIFTHKNKMF